MDETPNVPLATLSVVSVPRIKVYSDPSVEPLSTFDAKAHMGVTITADDTYIGALITTARIYCERLQGRAYVTQTLEVALDDWPAGDEIILPRPPLQSVTSVTYAKSDGTTATISSSDYVVDIRSEPGRIVLKDDVDWPTDELQVASAIVIRYVAGYGAASTNVPLTIRHALKMLVAHWYENREALTDGSGGTPTSIPVGLNALLDLDRVVTFP